MRKNIRDAVSMFGGEAAPDNPSNRYPRSFKICRIVLGVDSLDGYEEHLWAAGCDHVFPHLPRKEWQEHATLQLCGNSCPICRCPHCGGWRFEARDGGRCVPAAMCYFFRDALQQWFYDPVWVKHWVDGLEGSRYARSPEGQRVIACLKATGYDVKKVCIFLECALATNMWQRLCHSIVH